MRHKAGDSVRQIARDLSVSISTVQYYVASHLSAARPAAVASRLRVHGPLT